MRRLAATLAGLALVAVPASIAMASTHTAASTATQAPAVMRTTVPAAVPFHHPCHHLGGDQSTANPGV